MSIANPLDTRIFELFQAKYKQEHIGTYKTAEGAAEAIAEKIAGIVKGSVGK